MKNNESICFLFTVQKDVHARSAVLIRAYKIAEGDGYRPPRMIHPKIETVNEREWKSLDHESARMNIRKLVSDSCGLVVEKREFLTTALLEEGREIAENEEL